tara:strand:+ start:521 stop:712 length:192 start_codon:yes stop_codon:yes gene_type:complete
MEIKQAEINDVFKKEMDKVYSMFNKVLEIVKEIHIEKYTQEEYRGIVNQIYIQALKDTINEAK